MADLAKLVDDLSSLTVLEAADLAKMLEEKWGVSAAAAVAVAAAPGAGAAASTRGSSTGNSRRSRDAPLLFEELREFGSLENGKRREIVNELGKISHD
jgi:hypothetical protein